MALREPGLFTPYSTVTPFLEIPTWLPESEAERVTSYQAYEEMYWNSPEAFKLRLIDANDDEFDSLYIPNPRTICDITAHFYMKGLKIGPEAASGASRESADALSQFLARERFLSEFHLNKHAGVVRGDYVFHMTASPKKAPGTRISLKGIDPGSYFPVTDPDDPDEIVAVDIIDQITDLDWKEPRIKRLRYRYVEEGNTTRIARSVVILEVDNWWNEKRKILRVLQPETLLPPEIPVIPVYHFQNITWQGRPYGTSELAGYERLMHGINQSATDEDLGLALEGLGVYATDAPRPTDSEGKETDWQVAPGVVLTTPTNAKFQRVTGIGSIKPFQDHIGYMTESLFESTSTFRPSAIDVQVAESGIALAIKFLPEMAKLEQRDVAGVDLLTQLFHDWRQWHETYEGDVIPGTIIPKLGDKLPENRMKTVEELNNMYDRNVISGEYYRERMKEFGYEFPAGIEEKIVDELEKLAKARAAGVPTDPGEPNNQNRQNESNGTEANRPKART